MDFKVASDMLINKMHFKLGNKLAFIGLINDSF